MDLSRLRIAASVLACLALAAIPARGQDLEPRRWSHLPVGTRVLGFSLAEADGDLTVDPVLQLVDTEVKSRTEVVSYVHAFGLGDTSARVDVIVPYQQASWSGTLQGTPASTRRSGFADPRVRLSVNLVGAPPLAPAEFVEYRKAHPINTVVGAAVSVTVPWGEYNKNRLLNLGANRYTIRPQVGVLHTRGPWSYELTGSVFYFTDNDSFFQGTEREQDPLYALQAHVVRTFASGWWAAVGAAYGTGGRSKVNDALKDDRKRDVLWGGSFGFPVATNQSVKFGYIRRETHSDVGIDSDAFVAGWSLRF